MSLQDFHLLDNEIIDNSIIKRDFLKNCHHQAASLKESNQNIVFIWGEKINHHLNGNYYLEYELKVEKDVAVAANIIPVDVDAIRLVNNAFA